MKFSFARGALALAAMLTLASCGGGGKATFPINVQVSNVLYDGLVLTTNGQDLVVHPGTDTSKPLNLVFPNEIEYGEVYNVAPKGALYNAATATYFEGNTPKHQNCGISRDYPYNLPPNGTAGQLAKIQIYYVCAINTYPLGGKVVGLRGKGLVLANGSSAQPVGVVPATDTAGAATGADVQLNMAEVAYNATYGVDVLTQPEGQTCTVTGGANGKGSGTMDDAAEAAKGVSNLLVTCVNK
jgi:hypothetical protein